MRQGTQRHDRLEDRDDRPTGETPAARNPMSRAADLLRAGDEAIEEVLSGDSLQFLAASRQLGGQ
jgi:hypothetical protein